MSSYHDTSLGMGRRRSNTSRVRRGRGILSDILGTVGLGRRRTHRRTHRGRGVLDVIKKVAGFALPTIANAALGKLGGVIGSRLFGGRRRRRPMSRRRRPTLASLPSTMGGRRRRRRRVGHGLLL